MDAGAKRPRLGQLLLDQGLVDEDELAEALRLHEVTGRPLGEILTDELGLVSVAAMRDLLVLQKRWRPLGQMLVERGLITNDQLFEALHEQERVNKPLGQVVRDLFQISSLTLGRVLEDQRRLELELDRGYTSGLRGALQERARGRSLAPQEAEHVSPSALAQRLAPTVLNDAQAQIVLKHVESGERKVTQLNERLEEYRAEIVELREALADKHLTIIDLEGRIAELEALLDARPAAADD